jgi:hypothetical protein
LCCALVLVVVAAYLSHPPGGVEDWLDSKGLTPAVRDSGIIAAFLVFNAVFWLGYWRVGRIERRVKAAGGMVCARCRYDLSGVAPEGPAADGGTPRCPECDLAYTPEDVVAYWRWALRDRRIGAEPGRADICRAGRRTPTGEAERSGEVSREA